LAVEPGLQILGLDRLLYPEGEAHLVFQEVLFLAHDSTAGILEQFAVGGRGARNFLVGQALD
ncbi:MAG: hypothetical protein GWO24_04140, partial [Akkermansiaceae bacterium]|nr:hypothetical protein [Akkermansiaceae bacterium]